MKKTDSPKSNALKKLVSNKKKLTICIIALVLICIMLAVLLVRCINGRNALLTLKVDGKTYSISSNIYKFMLATWKGELVYSNESIQNHKPTQDAFWDIMDTYDGKTLETSDSYYRKYVLEVCKNYLISLYLFDKYNLELSETAQKEIDDAINELILNDGEGSKTKLNSVLSEYGINHKMLKEYYVMEAKRKAVFDHIYATSGPNLKNKFLNENYVHYYQIVLTNYTYIYETDKNGDTIYYNTATNEIMYKKTEFTQMTDKGEIETDSKGNIIYYTDVSRTHISYDAENGKRSHKLDSNGEYLTKSMTEDELAALEERAYDLSRDLQNVTKDAFFAKATEISDELNVDLYTDGCYLYKNMDYYASYGTKEYIELDEMLEKLSDPSIENGSVFVVTSHAGYRILFKCAPTDQAYDLEANEAWFESFPVFFTTKMFAEYAEPYVTQIEVNEKLYAKVPNMKEIAINYFY